MARWGFGGYMEAFWRNGRWHLLFPHNRHLDHPKN